MTQNKMDRPKTRIPDFQSHEEEAAFWDTHSLADYWDELEPAEFRFHRRPDDLLVIHLDRQSMGALTRLASHRGLSPSTLVHIWILEELDSSQTVEDKRKGR